MATRLRFMRGSAAALGLAAVVATASSAPAAPAAGRYVGELCVGLATAAPSCGKAELDLRRNGAASVRVDDITYRLKLHSSQLEAAVMHGSMQIDEFVANYQWAGTTLKFADTDKDAHYEVRFAGPRPR